MCLLRGSPVLRDALCRLVLFAINRAERPANVRFVQSFSALAAIADDLQRRGGRGRCICLGRGSYVRLRLGLRFKMTWRIRTCFMCRFKLRIYWLGWVHRDCPPLPASEASLFPLLLLPSASRNSSI